MAIRLLGGMAAVLTAEEAVSLWNEWYPSARVDDLAGMGPDLEMFTCTYPTSDIIAMQVSQSYELGSAGSVLRGFSYDVDAPQTDAFVVLWAPAQPSCFDACYDGVGSLVRDIRRAYEPFTCDTQGCWDAIWDRTCHLMMAIEE